MKGLLARKYRAAKLRSSRAVGKIAYRIYANAREFEIRNSYLYLPCHYFETAGTLRPASTIQKYDKIRMSMLNILGDTPGASVLDLGCNEGYFSLRLASDGFWVNGVDPDPSVINVAKFLQHKYSVNTASFNEVMADQDTLITLPSFDIVLFLSVFQKWCGQYDYDVAREMLSVLWKKTNRVMFFEMPDSLETVEDFKQALPRMGDTKEECRQFILEMLQTLESCSVLWLGDFDMEYRQEHRSLFAVTRRP